MTPQDAASICNVIAKLPNQPYLKNTSRDWWPKFIYHYTNIKNTALILCDGKLISRAQLERDGVMCVDNASPTIIHNTRVEVKGCVRLYFRPRTPTQYNNEGVRPINRRSLNAHCPVPVFFLFDSKDFFTNTDCYFSEGNMASPTCTAHNTARHFAQLPFEKIFHEGPVTELQKASITFHRNAEILVPNELALNSLKYLFCRSPAERETLLFTLPSEIRKRWAQKIGVDSKLNVFFRRWTFVESAILDNNVVVINFSPDSSTSGPFDLYYETIDLSTKQQYTFKNHQFEATKPFRIAVPTGVKSYKVKLKLDNDLVFAGEYQFNENPF